MRGAINWTRVGLAIASGLALALAFPKFDFGLLAWVAFVPLLYAVEGLRPRGVFGYAFLQGFTSYLATVYWVAITLHNFAGVAIAIAIIPLVLLAAILALYTAASFVAGEYMAQRLRIPLFVTLPIAWTAIEWLRSFFPVGFPWNLLGYAAYRNIELIQFAELTGVYGVSWLIMFFNTTVYEAVSAGRERRASQVWGLSALTATMIAVVAFGAMRISRLERARPAGQLTVAMVQGNIAQTIKWDPRFLPSSFKVYADQSEAAAREHADLIIWPEAAAAFIFQPDDKYPPALALDEGYRNRLLDLARRTGAPILFGAPALRIDDGAVNPYNRAYLVSGDGKVVNYYDKIRLVPFGEYVPLRSILGYFVNKIVVGMGDFVPGRQQTLFGVNGAKLGVLICYESIFPDLARREVAGGADILVNITNDAWYGDSSAPYQLLTMAAMRAVETKTPMVRVANTGISALIGPTGEITGRTDLFTRSTEVEKVTWIGKRTIYAKIGDVFAQICAALTAAGVFAAWFFPRKLGPLRSLAEELMTRNGHR